MISRPLCHRSFSKIPEDYYATTHYSYSKYWPPIRTEPTDSRWLLSLCICTHFTMAKCPGSYFCLKLRPWFIARLTVNMQLVSSSGTEYFQWKGWHLHTSHCSHRKKGPQEQPLFLCNWKNMQTWQPQYHHIRASIKAHKWGNEC